MKAAAVLLFIASFLLACEASKSPYSPTQHPGALMLPEPISKEIQQAYDKRYLQEGSQDKPRTRHLDESGQALYSNRLLFETSPYLLQHAHNPVNWFPWSDEAFEAAKAQNKPILLSVGYSTCHWCHVMEEESFEDLEVAEYLNEHYIAIKVDREERPDIDSVYMAAVQAITGRGGWPMTVWLDQEKAPFYGGTYFPARTGDRASGIGFLPLLSQISEQFQSNHKGVALASKQLLEHIKQRLELDLPKQSIEIGLLSSAFESYSQRFDHAYGGVQGAPKFPSSLPIQFLLRYHASFQNQDALTMATKTLDAMARGGMYDLLGGGFHRYSTDASWLVPHFEKMLYDNALQVLAYLDAYQVTKNPYYRDIVMETLDYVAREMTSPEGGFYSATDADSLNPEGEKEEGWFFTWTEAELEAVLTPAEYELIHSYYELSAKGDYEGRNIFYTTEKLEALAEQQELPLIEAQNLLKSSREKLMKNRQLRPAPGLDNKILSAWNGLMISAFARAGRIFNEAKYTEKAVNAAQFVAQNLQKNGRLLRSYNDGKAHLNAYLDDYAFYSAGLLDIYQSNSDKQWLSLAISLDKVLHEYYEDDESGAFYMTSNDHEALIAREKPNYDGAEPSGNSVAVLNLLRLSLITTDPAYKIRAKAALTYFGQVLSERPSSLSYMLLAADFYFDKELTLIIIDGDKGEKVSTEDGGDFSALLREQFLPNVFTIRVSEQGASEQADIAKVLSEKRAINGYTTAYLCEGAICQLPTTDVTQLKKQLQGYYSRVIN